MSDGEKTTRTLAGKTVAYGSLDDLMLPEMEAGKAYLIVIKGRSVGRMLQLQHDRVAVIGRAADADLPIEDEAVSRRHAHVEPTPEGFAVVDRDSTNGLFVNNARVKRHVLHDGDRVQLGASSIMKFCYQDAVEESFQKKLYESATRDPLTGTYNRQYLLDSLEAEFSYCARNNLALSLLMLDIDHFKQVNDQFGHLAGDFALREVAGLVQQDLRAEDILARYGGEEFSVLLRHADATRARAVAERIRLRLLGTPLEYEEHSFSLTVSIGVATLFGRSHSTPNELVRTADTYLYRAKQAGRNRTACALDPASNDGASGDTTAQVQFEGAAAARTPGDAPADEPPPARRTARSKTTRAASAARKKTARRKK